MSCTRFQLVIGCDCMHRPEVDKFSLWIIDAPLSRKRFCASFKFAKFADKSLRELRQTPVKIRMSYAKIQSKQASICVFPRSEF